MQDQPDGCSARNNFEDSFTEEGTVSVKAVFEGGLKFVAFGARKNSDIKNSVVKREEDRSSSPSTQ